MLATRLQYRNDLKDKIIAIEDSGYGDFEFSDAELNTYLSLAVARLFPALYKRLSQDGLTLTAYGTGDYGYCTATAVDRVYLVEDADELQPISGWSVSGSRITKLDTVDLDTVNVHYYDAYTLPNDDTTDAAIAAIWTPLVVLGALVEALESRQDSGVRGDPGVNQQALHEVSLIDRLVSRYETTKREMAMSLPVVVV